MERGRCAFLGTEKVGGEGGGKVGNGEVMNELEWSSREDAERLHVVHPATLEEALAGG